MDQWKNRGFYAPVVEFKNLEKMYANTKKQTQENMKKLTTHMVRRVPRMVGKRASERYSLPASDFYPPNHKVKTDRKTGEKKTVKKAGLVKIKGETLEDLTFTWEARRLTVQRFKMKPNAVPKKPQEPYDITFSVLRGLRQTLRDNGQYRHFVQDLKGVTQALYARQGSRKIEGVAKSLSVPIMIDNANVRPKILKDINAELEAQIKKLR
jgi:hypothetical protein